MSLFKVGFIRLPFGEWSFVARLNLQRLNNWNNWIKLNQINWIKLNQKNNWIKFSFNRFGMCSGRSKRTEDKTSLVEVFLGKAFLRICKNFRQTYSFQLQVRVTIYDLSVRCFSILVPIHRSIFFSSWSSLRNFPLKNFPVFLFNVCLNLK